MKKFVVYQLKDDFAVNLINQESFKENPYIPCSDIDILKIGFLPFATGNLGTDGEEETTYVKEDDQFIYIQVKEQKKLVPNKKKLQPRIDKALRKYAADENIEVSAIEKETRQAIEDKVFQDQLKHCFHSDTITPVVVDKAKMLLYVGSVSYKSAENVTACIRASAGTLPIIPLNEAVKSANIGDHLMQMIKDQYGEIITLGDYCKLEDEDKATHTVAKKDLYDAEDELSVIFKKRYTCKEVKLEHDGVYDYKVKSTLEFSSVRADASDKEASEDANLSLMANAVRDIVGELVKELGGL